MEARPCVPILRRGILTAMRLIRSPITDLSVAIVPSRQIAVLHKKHLNTSGPTDVLTFELDHDRRGRVISAEIVCCATVARRRSKRLGYPLSHELLLYAIHGLLHLSGFDDRTASAFAAMHSKEDEILTRLGIGPVFCSENRGPNSHRSR